MPRGFVLLGGAASLSSRSCVRRFRRLRLGESGVPACVGQAGVAGSEWRSGVFGRTDVTRTLLGAGGRLPPGRPCCFLLLVC